MKKRRTHLEKLEEKLGIPKERGISQIDPVTKPNLELIRCRVCGITSLDGSPKDGIPYPKIETRADLGDELVCEDCFLEKV